MTVRAWFTISALVLAALAAAFAFRLFAPIPAPEIIVRSGDVRLDARLVRACWPQRSADVGCREGDTAGEANYRAVPASGSFRIVVAYPVRPEQGSITIDTRSGRTVTEVGWTEDLRYELEPGRYILRAAAGYPDDAAVVYDFFFRVTRSGS